jgi:hypothetical protein
MMLSSLLAISWEPEIRGIIVVLIGVVVMMGSVYLILGTNVGARLGILVSLAGLAGWMLLMGVVWWVYGIGLQGTMPSWNPANPVSIIRDGQLLHQAEVLDAPIEVDGAASPNDVAQAAESELVEEGWIKLDEADPRRGQAIASADDILQNQAQEFAAGEYTAVGGGGPRGGRGAAVGGGRAVVRRSVSPSTSLRSSTSRTMRWWKLHRWCPSASSRVAHLRVRSSTRTSRIVTC